MGVAKDCGVIATVCQAIPSTDHINQHSFMGWTFKILKVQTMLKTIGIKLCKELFESNITSIVKIDKFRSK